jgi:hypothetical protein
VVVDTLFAPICNEKGAWNGKSGVFCAVFRSSIFSKVGAFRVEGFGKPEDYPDPNNIRITFEDNPKVK